MDISPNHIVLGSSQPLMLKESRAQELKEAHCSVSPNLLWDGS